MPIAEHSLALLGVVLLIGLLIPELLQRFHLPFATALIVVGAVIGPHGLDLVRADATLTVFAFLGATFQMLLAGFEARRLGNPLQRDTGVLFATTGLFPAAAAIGIALAAGLDLTAALLAGTIFMSSSILLVLSMLWHLKLQGSPLGDRISSLVVTLELAAAFGVFVLLKRVDPHPRFSLPILLGLVVSSVVFLRMFVPELAAFAFERLAPGTDEEALRRRTSFALALMLLTVFLYAGFGVHPVIGAFLAGFALASADGVEPLREKLQTIGYALFIPVFLFTIGLDVDVGMFARIDVRRCRPRRAGRGRDRDQGDRRLRRWTPRAHAITTRTGPRDRVDRAPHGPADRHVCRPQGRDHREGVLHRDGPRVGSVDGGRTAVAIVRASTPRR